VPRTGRQVLTEELVSFGVELRPRDLTRSLRLRTGGGGEDAGESEENGKGAEPSKLKFSGCGVVHPDPEPVGARDTERDAVDVVVDRWAPEGAEVEEEVAFGVAAGAGKGLGLVDLTVGSGALFLDSELPRVVTGKFFLWRWRKPRIRGLLMALLSGRMALAEWM
jgi:hypothetical protein